jgi:hypothetical protein
MSYLCSALLLRGAEHGCKNSFIPHFSNHLLTFCLLRSPGRHHTRTRRMILLLTFYVMVLSNIFFMVVLGSISSQNYPGGEALVLFHKTYAHNYTTRMFPPPRFSSGTEALPLVHSALYPTTHPYLQSRSSDRCLALPTVQCPTIPPDVCQAHDSCHVQIPDPAGALDIQ